VANRSYYYYTLLLWALLLSGMLNQNGEEAIGKTQRYCGLLPGKGMVSVRPTKRPSTKDLSSNNLKKTAVTSVQFGVESASSFVHA